jgi:nitrite reductase/ring-hydroxylating ferredoxin subunit
MAVAAAIAGTLDLLSVVPPNSSARRRGIKHAILNVLALLLFISVAAYRGGPLARPDQTSFILSGIGVFCLLVSGWLGGTLVFGNQIGVDRRFANAAEWRTVTVHDWNSPLCKDDELAPGQMLLATIQGARVAVGRCPDGLVAFDDRCSHQGGSLSDGALVGCTVQCPWHGSQFDVHTGIAIAGPARDSVKTYDAEVRGGQIYVFPKRIQPSKAA